MKMQATLHRYLSHLAGARRIASPIAYSFVGFGGLFLLKASPSRANNIGRCFSDFSLGQGEEITLKPERRQGDRKRKLSPASTALLYRQAKGNAVCPKVCD
jgi:hypothetical protein